MNKSHLQQQISSLFPPLLLFFLNGSLRLVQIFAEGWRWWLSLALGGAVVLASYAALQPPHYRSEGMVTITPRYLLEGYVLATQELTHHYAARLVGDERIARAMVEAGTPITPTVESVSHGGMAVGLTVEHPDASTTEAFTRALMVDLQNEIAQENRTRGENDRLTVEISPTSFATLVTPSWLNYALWGATGGFGVGVLWIYGLAFWRRGRLNKDVDVRQAMGLPLLGMIPRR